MPSETFVCPACKTRSKTPLHLLPHQAAFESLRGLALPGASINVGESGSFGCPHCGKDLQVADLVAGRYND
jgi:predicted RNA-binding Zn-ribbon protein involved in translation (DUF1610 family)